MAAKKRTAKRKAAAKPKPSAEQVATAAADIGQSEVIRLTNLATSLAKGMSKSLRAQLVKRAMKTDSAAENEKRLRGFVEDWIRQRAQPSDSADATSESSDESSKVLRCLKLYTHWRELDLTLVFDANSHMIETAILDGTLTEVSSSRPAISTASLVNAYCRRKIQLHLTALAEALPDLTWSDVFDADGKKTYDRDWLRAVAPSFGEILETIEMQRHLRFSESELLQIATNSQLPFQVAPTFAARMLRQRREEANRKAEEKAEAGEHPEQIAVEDALSEVERRYWKRRQAEEQKQRELYQRYVSLLRRLVDAPTEVSGDELADVLELLDIDRERLHADMDLIREHDRLVELGKQDATAIQAKLPEMIESQKRFEKESVQQLRRLTREIGLARSEVRRIRDVPAEIQKLAKRRSRLFAPTSNGETPRLLCDIDETELAETSQ